MNDDKLSPFIKTLVPILLDPTAGVRLTIAAADIISLDAQINDWFAGELKKTATEDELISVLERTEQVYELCQEAVREYKDSSEARSAATDLLESARNQLLNLRQGRL